MQFALSGATEEGNLLTLFSHIIAIGSEGSEVVGRDASETNANETINLVGLRLRGRRHELGQVLIEPSIVDLVDDRLDTVIDVPRLGQAVGLAEPDIDDAELVSQFESQASNVIGLALLRLSSTENERLDGIELVHRTRPFFGGRVSNCCPRFECPGRQLRHWPTAHQDSAPMSGAAQGCDGGPAQLARRRQPALRREANGRG